MKIKKFAADISCLPEALAFIDGELAGCEIDNRTRNLIKVACEEVLANVMSYAYGDAEGILELGCGFVAVQNKFSVCIEDSGVPYNPLAKQSPNLEASLDEREIGGLGIYMYRTIMDEVSYKYENGKNILQLSKNL